MGEKVETVNMYKQQGMGLGVVGLILLIIGALIVFVPGMPFRGSGLGTILIVLGIVGLFVVFYRRRPEQTKTQTG
jgi:hypothetical protein